MMSYKREGIGSTLSQTEQIGLEIVFLEAILGSEFNSHLFPNKNLLLQRLPGQIWIVEFREAMNISKT